MSVAEVDGDDAGSSMLVPVTCDMCGADHARFRYRLTATQIVTCEDCGFSYVNPRAPSPVLQQRLQEWASEDVVDQERLRIAFEPNTLKLYARHLDRLMQRTHGDGRRFLDVGCATGAFLTVARDEGWDVEGLEYGRASAQYARDELGLTIHNTSIYDFAPEAPYDAISFLEVIEHLESPSAALERLNRWLKPDGLLLLSTPNFDSLFRRLHGERWWVINCEDEHIMFFTPGSLRAMLDKHGFDVEHMLVRSIDVPGILKGFKRSPAAIPDAPAEAEAGYYASRSGKERAKTVLRKLGLLGAARLGMRGLDWMFSARLSPFYGWGEQLVCIARKRT